MVAVARAEDKELAGVYVGLLKKHGIEGKLRLADVPGKRRETYILVPEKKFDEAYEVIQAKVDEGDFYGMSPRSGFGSEGEDMLDEPFQAA